MAPQPPASLILRCNHPPGQWVNVTNGQWVNVTNGEVRI